MALVFSTFDFYLLRTPRLPAHVVYELNAFHRKEDAWEYIIDILRDPEILDSIYLASEDLLEKLNGNLANEYTPADAKILSTIYKYVSRMAGRPTPYGKFSGVSLGEINELPTSLELSGELTPSYRLDMGFTGHLSNLALQNQVTQYQLAYFTNTTLLETSNYFKYIEFKETDNKRSYHWTKVAKNPLLKCILDFAKEGKHFFEIVHFLQQIGIPEAKADHYLRQLIEIKLLISELEPVVTGSSSENTLSRLQSIGHETFPISILNSLENCLKVINSNKDKEQSFVARKKFNGLATLPSKNLFQADMLIDTSTNKINKQIIDELVMELEELSILNRAKTPLDLKSFCRKFSARYGDIEVPLLEAIDPENGIGYGKIQFGDSENSPLLEGLGRRKDHPDHNYKQIAIQSIMDRYWPTGVNTTSPIELDHQDIQALRSQAGRSTDNLPVGFYVLGNLFDLNGNDRNGKEFCFNLLAAGGVSAIPLMTRFSHLDTKLEGKLQACADWEEQQAPETIFAEVVYLPDNRAGNILTRPRFFKYEIPIIGQSTAKGNFKISLNDLWISVRQGKVILRSKRLNKQIIPRLSSAHNFHYGMVVYRFLCDLQFQSDCLDLSWDWRQLSKQPFLPRVSYKHIILSRAKWNISKAAVHSLFGFTDNKSKILLLREKFDLPDMVSLTEGDNELVVDLRSPLGAEIVLKQLENRDIILYEYLFGKYDSPVRDVMGEQYNNEIIIPLKVDKLVKGIKFKPFSDVKVKRSFQPGSEWVFIKIYCGLVESERILSHYVMRLTNELMKEETIEKWFFIRYHDPEPHIRLRLLLRKKGGKIPFQHVTECINHHLESSTIHRIVYDTYERELERYGEDNIEICESIFHMDSKSIVTLLPLFKEREGNHLRWLTGMLGVDYLLTAFGLDANEKMSLVTSLRDAFLIEFNGYDKLKYKLDRKYRENRNRIQSFFDPHHNNDCPIHNNLLRRFNFLRHIAEPFRESTANSKDLFDLLVSLSHMFINRVFISNQREQEMFIYHFLTKHYQGIIKRGESDYLITNSIHNDFVF
ncbi:lantibiotic dehydratase [Sphingobacterium faecium]|uniref:lantibiotic dehydratase n=1 Tax=Sphingobacterium faecium TaxID=34087 RepID=UPI003207A8FB